MRAAIPAVKAIEAGKDAARTFATAFPTEPTVGKLDTNPTVFILPTFIEKVNLLVEKYPLLIDELAKISQSQLGGFASKLDQDYLTFGWLIERKKSKRQLAMRMEVHFLHRHSLPDTVSQEPLYLAVIYDKSDQKLVKPEPLELL